MRAVLCAALFAPALVVADLYDEMTDAVENWEPLDEASRTCTALCKSSRSLDTDDCIQNICQKMADAPTAEQQACAAPEGEKTRVLLVTLGIGVNYFMLGVQWFASAVKHLCNGERHEVHLLMISDTSTWSKIRADEKNSAQVEALRNYYVWPADDAYVRQIDPGVGNKKGFVSLMMRRPEILLDAGKTGGAWVDAQNQKVPEHKTKYSSYDFILHSDVDQLFVADVCEDLLGHRIALAHSSFWDKSRAVGPYDGGGPATVPHDQQHMFPYFSAQIYGGSSKEFVRMNEKLDENMKLKQSEPVYHDETHLNWLFNLPDFMPTTTLSRAFKWKTAKDGCREYFGGSQTHVCSAEVGERYCAGVAPFVIERKYLEEKDESGRVRQVKVSHH